MAGDPTVSKPYSVPVGDAFYFASATGQPGWAGPVQTCAAPSISTGQNFGGACFKVFGPNKVTITIKDANVAHVGASLDVYDSAAVDPNPLSSSSFWAEGGANFCDTTTLTLSKEAAILYVEVGAVNFNDNFGPPQVGLGTLDPTMSCGAPSPGTTGTITVSGPGVDTGSNAARAARSGSAPASAAVAVAAAHTASVDIDRAGVRGSRFRLL
jgi:hypothetical protein